MNNKKFKPQRRLTVTKAVAYAIFRAYTQPKPKPTKKLTPKEELEELNLYQEVTGDTSTRTLRRIIELEEQVSNEDDIREQMTKQSKLEESPIQPITFP